MWFIRKWLIKKLVGERPIMMNIKLQCSKAEYSSPFFMGACDSLDVIDFYAESHAEFIGLRECLIVNSTLIPGVSNVKGFSISKRTPNGGSDWDWSKYV